MMGRSIGSGALFIAIVAALVTFPYSAGKHVYAPGIIAISLNMFFLIYFLVFSNFNLRNLILILGCLLSVYSYYIYAFRVGGFHFHDFLLGLAPLLYLFSSILFLTGRKSKSKGNFQAYFIFLVYVLFYFGRISFGVAEPGLLLENNLELVLFSSAAMLIYINNISCKSFFVRAAFITFVLFFFFLADAKGYLLASVVAIAAHRRNWVISLPCALIFFFIFFDSIYSVWVLSDRYFFLSSFLSSFSVAPQLGMELGSDTCNELSKLLPRMVERIGHCSSVMFHGSVPRIIYDYGILIGCAFFLFLHQFFRHLNNDFGSSLFVFFFIAGIFISVFGSTLFLASLYVLRGFSDDPKAHKTKV